ncbi:MAG TPA: undecaprenyl-phosphate glucose phosphotransferase [Micropepsaceae bacterium]
MDMRSPIRQTGTLGLSSAPVEFRATGHLQPQNLGYLSLLLDVALFAGAGLAARPWVAAGPSALMRMIQFATIALALMVFFGMCRAIRAHDPLNLLHSRALPRISKMVLCFAIPVLVPLAISLPFIPEGDPEVRSFASWLACFEVFSIVFAIFAHSLFQISLPVLGRTLFARQRVAVVGSGESAERLIRWVELSAPGLFEVIGVFDDRESQRTQGSAVAYKIRGSTSDLVDVYKSSAFDKVVIALPHSAESRLLDLLRRLRQLPVDIVLAPDLMGFHVADEKTAEMAGLKLLSLAERPIRAPQRLLKGAIDICAAAFLLLTLSPLLLAIAIAIKLDSPGHVLFRQRRHGLGDRLFDVFKFRTMHADLGDPSGRKQTKRSDPRVTRVGAFLRKTSLDELPQLLNVLMGEMSLVGPRPHSPHMLIGDKRHYEIVAEYSFRHRVKPGITGLAQVSGYRGAVDTPDHLQARIDLDLYYIDHWSLWMDFKILCRTAIVCLSGMNAF